MEPPVELDTKTIVHIMNLIEKKKNELLDDDNYSHEYFSTVHQFLTDELDYLPF